MQLNKTITDFIAEKNVNCEKMRDIMFYNKRDINTIIARYGMYKNKTADNICIADIIGKYRGKTQEILVELNDLFDREGELYKRRSTSMLEYDSTKIIDKLSDSFEKEPIELAEIKNGKYIVANNGIHRIALLRFHYYSELFEENERKSLEYYRKKYTIEAEIEYLDYIKTYSKYILNLIYEDVVIENEINADYKKTDNVVMYFEDGESIVLTDMQLIEYVRDSIGNKADSIWEKVSELYDNDVDFKEYIDTYEIFG